MPVMKKLTCPYCDSDYVERAPPSPIAVESGNAWYQCNYCVRMWSVPKVALSFQDRS
jgi:transposase-like protein